MGSKPTIRILRNMARSGGTLIGKCIGCMDSVVMLSEVHPKNLKVTNPMKQAFEWFGLISEKDLARWKRAGMPSALQFLTICHMRAHDRGDTLVLRDWSHLDYIGVPFVEPGYGFELGGLLCDAFEVVQFSTTRHPIDQYLSLRSFAWLKDRLTVGGYLRGCAEFARYASEHGFVRYEDFVSNPDGELEKICKALQIEFDPSYASRWHTYTTITGDNLNAGGRASDEQRIQPMPRKPIDDDLLREFRESEDYAVSCGLLGYEL